MSSETYIILRKLAAGQDDYGGVMRGGDEAPKPELGVEVEKLESKDVSELHRDESVESFAPSMDIRLIEPAEESDAKYPPDQTETWGVRVVGAADTRYSGRGITVAVLDSGIDAGHPAFSDMTLIQKDFTGEGEGDPNGHGTHCAGTIFGRDVEGLRIGIARGVERALIGKVTNRVGAGSTDQLVEAIHWAVDQGARIISMSLSIDFAGFAKRLQDNGYPPELAISKALVSYRRNLLLFEHLAGFVQSRRGTQPLIVVAAGNESRRDERTDFVISSGPPAAADGFLAVGALGRDDDTLKVARFSNNGVEVSGPGVDVISAKTGGGLASKSGTSMAGPHVAGVAALWAEKLPQRDVKILQTTMIGRTTRQGLPSEFDPLDVGAGLVQAPRI